MVSERFGILRVRFSEVGLYSPCGLCFAGVTSPTGPGCSMLVSVPVLNLFKMEKTIVIIADNLSLSKPYTMTRGATNFVPFFLKFGLCCWFAMNFVQAKKYCVREDKKTLFFHFQHGFQNDSAFPDRTAVRGNRPQNRTV